MSRESWLIEPHDSLIVRDGRPFNNTAGSRAKSVDFPFPSTIIGTFKTQTGLKNGGNWSNFPDELIEKIQQVKMFGALLAEIKDDGKTEFFSPAPADSLLINSEQTNADNLFPLVPLQKNYLSNLPKNGGTELHLLGIEKEINGKPNRDVKYWYWNKFEKWLIKAREHFIESNHLGLGGFVQDCRTHVNIDYETKSNEQGSLFQTRGLEFTTETRKRLALAVQVEYPLAIEKKPTGGFFPLGGERRISRWEKKDFQFPTCPKEVFENIREHQACRIVLLTPAYFDEGFILNISKIQVKAVAVNRSQVISGWDFALKEPKPTRRLTPAGTVYFVKIDSDNIDEWIEQMWFNNIGDDEQLKRDGFGLVALGSWDGKTDKEV